MRYLARLAGPMALVLCVSLAVSHAGKKKKEREARKQYYEIQLDDYLKGPSSELDPDTLLYGTGKTYTMFKGVAKEFSVKIDVLLAIALNASGFEMVKPSKTYQRGWGYMGLGNKSNPMNLKRGARLIKEDIKNVKTDVLTNIRAGASVLRACKMKKMKLKPKNVGKKIAIKHYEGILKCYADTKDKFENQVFADEIFSTLQSGYTHKLKGGEVITIEAQDDLADFEPAPLTY